MRREASAAQRRTPPGERRPRPGRQAAPARQRDGAGRRAPRRVVWRRRLVAALVLALLAAGVVVFVLRLDGAPPTFVGVWAGSDGLLGSTRWRITHVRGDEYRITGMKVQGVPLRTLRLENGQLVATGSTAGSSWSIAISSVAGGNQILTEYQSGGEPPIQLRFTSVPPP